MRNRKRIFLWIAAALCLKLSSWDARAADSQTSLFSYVEPGRSIVAVIDSLSHALNEKRYDDALTNFSREFSDAVRPDVFAAILSERGLESVEIQVFSLRSENQRAYVVSKLNYNANQRKNSSFAVLFLKEEKGRWQLLNFPFTGLGIPEWTEGMPRF